MILLLVLVQSPFLIFYYPQSLFFLPSSVLCQVCISVPVFSHFLFYFVSHWSLVLFN